MDKKKLLAEQIKLGKFEVRNGQLFKFISGIGDFKKADTDSIKIMTSGGLLDYTAKEILDYQNGRTVSQDIPKEMKVNPLAVDEVIEIMEETLPPTNQPITKTITKIYKRKPYNKTTDAQKKEILKRFNAKETTYKIAKDMKLPHSNVLRIAKPKKIKP